MKFFISCQTTINQPLEKIRPLVSDFGAWKTWSPWSVVEPTHAGTITGNIGSVGHTMTWNGVIIGSGELVIRSEKFGQIDYDLRFLTPQKLTATTSFSFNRLAKNKTEVSWQMDGSMPWFLFWMIPMIRSLIEMDYTRGLTMLKSVAETGTINATTTHNGMVEFEGFAYSGLQKTSHIDEMGIDMPEIFAKISADTIGKNIQPQHWISVYKKTDMNKKKLTYISAISDQKSEAVLGDDYISGQIKSGRMLKITHKGSYKFLGNAWSMGMMTMRAQKLKKAGDPFEYYHNNPLTTAEEDLLTDVYFPVK